jgi:hypothetical protein
MISKKVAEKKPIIDAVVTWVDGSNSAHRAKMKPFLNEDAFSGHPGANPTRFGSMGEINYCVLSILRFAPFVRNIFIVTDGQDPKVTDLVAEHFPERVSSIKIIDHSEIFKGFEHLLPTFSSISIETMLWRIPGLSDNYVYFNDDTFLIRPTSHETWFVKGRPVIRGAWTLAPYPRIAYDRLRKFVFGKLLGRTGYQPRHSFHITQWLSAKMVGYVARYFVAGHTPHPIKRDALEKFFEDNPSFLEMNASHKFREYNQFNIAALSNHLEIKAGISNFGKKDVAYLQPRNRGEKYVLRKRNYCDKNNNIKFLCVQTLEACSEKTQKEIFDWLNQIIVP